MRIIVRAGTHDRRSCPVSVHLSSASEGRYPVLLEEAAGRAIPAQVEPEGDGVRLWWILDNLQAGT
ncbi:MAG TPA: hypothetical protein ENF74_03670, partial [Firmicutes bacterium]|nr:hypothetical protein [Bacillota bacterium]